MSVGNAAKVLSDTVAQDIEDQGWPDIEALVKIIWYSNKFFDCLNGAYRDQDIRTKNKNLAAYRSANDRRLAWLGVPNPKVEGQEYDPEDSEKLKIPFLKYLEDWNDQVQRLAIDAKLKEKCKLAHQTLYGIEMSIRGIAGSIRYLSEELSEPPKFILAKIFSQDPLEQHFSQQRSARGGSRNRNYAQFQSKQVSAAVERDMGIKCRRGNSSEITRKGMEVSDEPLPKRRQTSRK